MVRHQVATSERAGVWGAEVSSEDVEFVARSSSWLALVAREHAERMAKLFRDANVFGVVDTDDFELLKQSEGQGLLGG